MNNILLVLLAVSLLMMVLVSGGLARLFKAKRPFMWLAFLVVLLAVATGFGVYKYYVSDSIIILASALATYSVLLLLLMGMGILESLVTSIANIAVVGVILFAGGMALDKYQHSQLVEVMLSYVKDNQSFISFASASPKTKHDVQSVDAKHEDEFVLYSEELLLPEGTRQQENTLDNKAYHPLKLADAYTMKGRSVRVLKKDGKVLKGKLIEIRKNSLVLEIYVSRAKGMIIAPLALSVIRKLEVYR